MRRSLENVRCECSDPGCPAAHGSEQHGIAEIPDRDECGKPATMLLRRIDMDDGQTEIAFCDECGKDALESGVFA